ncbi:hypothetical protein AC579_1446 [Pseudocercospora musae]|uniref:Carboxypeptidase n=1 Tax=Pseudocercospora musae TaxID=113226 RepID=A0A139IMT1_9PEZI|nr:hypothetical protein AC579_1446 [Pseudocercospora musae]
MAGISRLFTVTILLLCLQYCAASLGSSFQRSSKIPNVKRQYFPKSATNVTTIKTPTGVTIRYKKPGEHGVCETTPGVGSYSGYIDLAPNVHVFFWFFESRRDPANDDFTLWLNGGPGSDSLIGLFTELGPCRINEDLETFVNPHSWSNVSNMLFLSQPVGVGFSNQGVREGAQPGYAGSYINLTQAEQLNLTEGIGTWPLLDPLNVGEIDTTDLAATAAWHVLQGFLSGLPQLAGNRATTPKTFNLWTESYGGHYGPAFFNFFYSQNVKIKNGSLPGYEMSFKSLGIINGIIDERYQVLSYPEFALNNSYGIKLYNESVYMAAKLMATYPLYGCLDQIDTCIQAAQDLPGGYVGGKITNLAAQFPNIAGQCPFYVNRDHLANSFYAAICTEAGDICRDGVESLYYGIGDRGAYDIRHPSNDPTPDFVSMDAYLNQAHVQNAIGVSLNYTEASGDIYGQFQETGDFIYPNFKKDLESILDSGVRVVLPYGDADYICNWFGGEKVSLAMNYTYSKEFNAAGYEPFVWSEANIEAGEVREYGNFSFIRIYESGHTIPFYQPGPSLTFFKRAISGVDIAQGIKPVTANLTSNGPPNATHTESFVSIPTDTNSAVLSAYAASLYATYSSLVVAPEPTG